MDINIDRIRSEMTNREQWLCWEAAMRDGKETKLPKDPETGGFAQTDDPSTWGSFLNANGKVKAGQMDGVGFVFTEDDSYVGIDLDNCRDPETGEWEDWALDVMQDIGGWIEISPSGTGAHIILKGEIPGDRNRKGDLEMYEDGRFFTITGQLVDESGERLDEDVETPEIKEAQQALDAVYDRFLAEDDEEANETNVDVDPDKWGHLDLEDHDGDSPSTHSGGANPDELPAALREIVDTAKSANNGYQFTQLWRGNWEDYYPSHSEGDMAFCDMLAFWFSGDPERMDRVFRASGLMRPKWDDVRYSDGSTYGERTIEKAIASVDDHYDDDYYDDLVDGEDEDAGAHGGGEDIDSGDEEADSDADSSEDDGEDDDDSGGEFSSGSATEAESAATSDAGSSGETSDSSETAPSEGSAVRSGNGSEETTQTRSQDRNRGRGRRREGGRKRSQKRRDGIPDDIGDSAAETEQSSPGPSADDADESSDSGGDSTTELNFDSESDSESGGDDGPADGSMFDEFAEDDEDGEGGEDDEDEYDLPPRDEAEGLIDDMEEDKEESSDSSTDSGGSSSESPEDAGGDEDRDEESESESDDTETETDAEDQDEEEESSDSSDSSSITLGDKDKFQKDAKEQIEDLQQFTSRLAEELDTSKSKLRHDVELVDDKLERVYYELQQYEEIIDKREDQVETMYQLLVLLCHVQPEPIFDRIENVLVNEDEVPPENIFNESVEEIIEHYHEDTSMMDSDAGGAPAEQSAEERGISEEPGAADIGGTQGRGPGGRTRADGEGSVSADGSGKEDDDDSSFWSDIF